MFLRRFQISNWKNNQPNNLLEYLATPSPIGLRLLNFIVQKIFRNNSEVPFMVHFTSTVSKTVILGKNVATYFSNSGGCYIQGINTIYIGDHTIFAPGVKIISANHELGNYTEHNKSIGPIIIGKYCWIGANSVILPGVTIGNNVVIAAGSIVTKSFDDNLIIGGNPAKVIKPNLAKDL